jgi:hypothetical protein
MPNFQWLTWLQAQQALAGRLADPGMVFWTKNELILYLRESLQTWNALTEMWNADYAFTATNAGGWFDLSTMNGSPRLKTIVDTDLYNIMEAHLLEPVTGGTWTGTSQFAISDLQGALHRRVNEVIQNGSFNLGNLPQFPSTPNVRRTFFTDSTLEPRRVRFLPDSGFGSPVTLSREDTLAFDAFEPGHLQTNQIPDAWSVITSPPLAMDVDTAPNVAGVYDLIALFSETPFSPPNATPIRIPNDWTWLPKWGALADILGRESEATDRMRSDYCLKRYVQGLEIMKASNWLVSATINGVPCDTPSLREMDAFSPEWQNNAAGWPSLVTAGPDFVAVCPTPATIAGVTVNLVANAPIPALDTDFVQVSRDIFDVILGYAQVLAALKQGGEDFVATKSFEDDFYRAAVQQNKRLSKMGLFADLVHREGKREDLNVPRQ